MSGNAAAPFLLMEALAKRAPELRERDALPRPLHGRRPLLQARDGGQLPPQLPLRGPGGPRLRQRRPLRLRAHPPPPDPQGHPQRDVQGGRGHGPVLAARRARVHEPGRRSGRQQGRPGGGQDRHRPGERQDAAPARGQLPPRIPCEADRGGEHPAPGARREARDGCGKEDRRHHRRHDSRRRHAADGHRGHPRRRALPPRGQARPGDPHGDDLRRPHAGHGAGHHHGHAQDAPPGQGDLYLRPGHPGTSTTS